MSCDNVNCNYSEWVKLPCLNNDKLIKLRTIITPSQGTNSTSCDVNQNNYIDTETCILPNNCELSNWSDWSPCFSGKQIKTRQIKNLPKIGGDTCPESLTAYFETQDCTVNNTTTGTCTYANWSDWSPCTTVAGLQVRTRGIQTAGGNCSNNYEDYVQKQPCNNNPNSDCVLSDWSWSPCSTKCGTGFRIGTRRILENAKNDGQLCPIDINSYYIKESCTSNEYCPVDCITVADWGSCNNNVRTRNVTPAQKCGQCPQGTETTQTCNNCTVSNWGACNIAPGQLKGTRIRTITPASNGGVACTAAQNALPLSEECTNCTVSWGACNGTKRTKIITQPTNGGTACTTAQNTPEEQTCSHCTVSDWGACNSSTGKENKTVNQATNGGTACTAAQNATITERPCGVTVYENNNYGGRSSFLAVRPSVYNINQMGISNDMISSVRVPSNIKVTLYEHDINWYSGGRPLVLTADEPNLSSRSFNDLTSSIKVERV
jgi:hypothetical protein